jgi:protein-S-isoprenylcysteine O-methyltransferase Ste14
MGSHAVFRAVFVLAAIAQVSIRVHYQSKVLPDRARTTVTGANWRLIPGAIAALTTITFGLAYIFFPNALPWSYGDYPDWIRWLGALALLAGTSLLAAAHHHLGKSFHSLVVQKSGQVLVESGPYRFVRHPIYTAYILNYFSGGLLASSLLLTFVPGPLYILFIALRLREEEAAMVDQFGAAYEGYMTRTGRFLPDLRALLRHSQEH